MSEWWTYRPSDFLMFSPRAYARLIERVNESLWPLPLIGALAAALLLALLWRRDRWSAPLALRVLAFAWGSVALLFHARHFASINTAAPALAWAFGLQALVFLALARWCSALAWRTGPATRRWVALALLTSAVAYPVKAVATGSSWMQAQTFGLLPDPTLLATLGLLLGLQWPPAQRGAVRAGRTMLLWGMPLAACLLAVGLHWALYETGR